MHAITLHAATAANLRASTPRRGGRTRTALMTTGIVLAAAVLGFVGSVAWAQESSARTPAPRAQQTPAGPAHSTARGANRSAASPRAPDTSHGASTIVPVPAPWTSSEPAVLCACVRDKPRA